MRPGSPALQQAAVTADCPLPAVVHPDVARLTGPDAPELRRLAEMLGTPLHVIFPHLMRDRIERFRQCMASAGIPGGRIYFAEKASRAGTFLAVAAAAGIGADVSSAQEFAAALDQCVPGTRISVSGPAKPPKLLFQAVSHGALTAIDQPSELDTLLRIAGRRGTRAPVRVSLRLRAASSRFGMPARETRAVLEQIAALGSPVALEGIAFHVPEYDSGDRVAMISRACDVIAEAAALGLAPGRINIGGGLAVTYADPASWDLSRAVEREFVGGRRPGSVYPYASSPAGPEQLEEILRASREALAAASARIGRPVAVDVEPGRSLLDQAGITLFRVREVRPLGDRWVVVVDGSSTHLSESQRSEYLIDPVLITDSPPDAEPFPAAIAADTCLENDWHARRYVPWPHRPGPGQLIAFINTAGYQQHSRATEFHRVPLPRTVAAFPDGPGWRFADDSTVSVADLAGAAP